MSAIRKPGKINDNTTLIDVGMQGVHGITAVYLIQGARKCLIDGGTRTEAPLLVKNLKALDAFPPDLILTTHPHWDHAQGIPWLRKEAASLGKKIEVLAGKDALPLLADASFNDIFGKGPYESIQDVTPVQEGDTIDLGGIILRIYEVPGHCRGHVAILDEKNRNLFVGDALGGKPGDQFFFPPFMPPTWDPDAYLASVEKLKQLPYQTLCLAHFGCIYGDEARNILDESLKNYQRWWQWYGKHADRLSDTDYMLKMMRQEINPVIPEIKPVTSTLKVMFGLMSAVTSILGTRTAMIDKLACGDLVSWLGAGYSMGKNKSG